MRNVAVSTDLIQQTINFHGHSCPGLAFGIRASELAMRYFNRASDEEIVAVVETDMCAVDAIQFLTGCTFGKGNLIHLDYGKNAFTFYRRHDGKGMRIMTRPNIFPKDNDELDALQKEMIRNGLTPEEQKRYKKLMESRVSHIMDAKLEELFEAKPANGPVPKKARILESLICQSCGEMVMESRTRTFLGKTFCIPCFNAVEKTY
ncbi:MAG: TraR/DksA C4-type zinc finger protein [Deltaproteobacteria bacterium]|nr:TraR/DksA C4-type zinc finger protein [Deltaproteobacteria bacterium]